MKSFPERLVTELTAHPTLAPRAAVGRSPNVALTPLLARLVSDTFQATCASGVCLEASVRQVYMSAHAADLNYSPAEQTVDERCAAWETKLPLSDEAALWDYLTKIDQESRLSLLAHCLSFGINTLLEKVNGYGAGISDQSLTRRMAQADIVAQAANLDMVEGGLGVDSAHLLEPRAQGPDPLGRVRGEKGRGRHSSSITSRKAR